MVIRINNSYREICLMFFRPSLLAEGHSRPEMVLPWGKGKHLQSHVEDLVVRFLPSEGADSDGEAAISQSQPLAQGSFVALCWCLRSCQAAASFCAGNFSLSLSIFTLSDLSQGLFYIKHPVIFWTLSSLGKFSLGIWPSRPWGFFLFRLMSVSP